MDDLSGPRILLTRLSAIGDVLHGLPVACALRRKFPTAHIGWIVEGRAGDLLVGHPAIDALVRVPRRWLKSPRAVLKLRRELRAQRFEIAIDMQGLAKSAIASRLSGAQRRIGLGGIAGRELSTWLNNELVIPHSTHVIDRNLELLRPLGIEHPDVEFRLPSSAATEAAVGCWLRGLHMPCGGFAVLNPGAGWPSKLWPVERFAAVAQHLGQVHKVPSLVVWAGGAERTMADAIIHGAGGHARLSPATSLTELAAVLRQARLMVAADTGPLHLSVAVGTPCVGLFGPMPMERNGPYGDAHIALQAARLEGTSRARRSADNATMRAISVDMVVAACEQLLARDQAQQRHLQVA